MTEPVEFNESTIAEMSVALSQGRRVRFTPGTEPSTSLDVGDHLERPAADFLGTKVDEIQGLLEKGFEVNVHPDGSIFAYTPSRSERYLANPDAALDNVEVEFVRAAIRGGDTVTVEVDGSIAYQKNTSEVVPAADQVAKRIAHFDEQVTTGKLAEAAAAGKNFEVAGDGTMSYVSDADPADPADPAAAPGAADPNDLVTSPPTPSSTIPDGDDLRIEAQEAAQIARQIREVSYDRLEEDVTTRGIARDESARKSWSLDQEANAADMQVKRELATVDRMREHAKLWEGDAKGDDIFAHEAAERVGHSTALANAAQARADSATQRAATLREEAQAATADVANLETEIEAGHDAYQKLAEDAKEIEGRGELLDLAASTEDQADAADERAATLRAAGDEKGAVAAEAESAQLRASVQENVDLARAGDYDDDVLGDAGIYLPEGFEQQAPAVDATGTPTGDGSEVPTRTIDMEPEIIEGTPPRVIDMEPEIIEGTPPRVIDMEPEIIEVSQQVDVDMPDPSAAMPDEPSPFVEDLSAIEATEADLNEISDF